MNANAKKVSYWTTTILIAFFIGSGGAAQLAQFMGNPHGAVPVLRYPMYFFAILGFWKVLGAIAILVPRFPRLKEWAYAGIFFDLTGAVVSVAAVGSYGVYAFHIVAPLVLTLITVASWALRPESRTVGMLFPAKERQAGVNTGAARIA
ncbi:MAG: DoxX family protein [Acidobacteriaceae bacterium]